MSKIKNIEGPYMREQLIYVLRDLSDLEYQGQEWLGSNHPYAFWSNLDMVYDFIFNDRSLDTNPEAQIDYSIRNKAEMDIIVPVVKALDVVYEKIGPKKLNAAYWNTDLWLEVVEKARIAYEFIKQQGEDKEFIEWIEDLAAEQKKKYV